MSIDTKQMIHIADEAVVLTGVSAYFIHKNKQLLDHIEQLEAKIQQQEEILQNHDNLILKLMNAVNNINLGQMPQMMPQMIPQMMPQMMQTIIPPAQILNPIDSNFSDSSNNSVVESVNDGIDDKSSVITNIDVSPVIKKPKNKKPIQKLPENITSSKKVILMMSTPVMNVSQPYQENKVEEINDEYIIPKNKVKLDQLIDINKIESENELDDELEEELKDLE